MSTLTTRRARTTAVTALAALSPPALGLAGCSASGTTGDDGEGAVANLQGVESAGYLMQTEPGKWRTFGEPFERNLYGVVFNRDNAELGEAVQQALDYMIEDGSYGEILEKLNVGDAAVDEAVINGATEG